MNAQSGLTIAVAGGATANGSLIVQTGGSGRAQQWRVEDVGAGCYQLANAQSGMAMDNPGGSTGNGTQMQQWTFAPGNINQTWCFHAVSGGLYSIQNRTSGLLLAVRDGRSSEGDAVQQWAGDPAAPQPNQSWRLVLA
ncbi:RICIN domain-containing protein [Dactylosporangium sp. AC04546]|uniref:RICIN domain-containing protein n=1 Tax=Dactylosporangium sp. AC04546 TaxID=2862460 RepID=UPI001EDE1EBE|nr:RICIN domain-containing protein [Dactylosporangium sp. AC04546]WVK86724.1 RICIN domain-containing protein [Dactylosporangium sp. AC04546]